MARYVTDPWFAWLLIALVFAALVLWWRLMQFAINLLAWGLRRLGPGAPMPEEGE
jgi:hypothetical protein